MIGTFDDQGRIVLSDAETADAWVGNRPEERAVGCPECGLVHWDADALVCCDTRHGLPLISNGNRWRQAPDQLVMDHLYRSTDAIQDTAGASGASRQATG